VGSCLLPLGLVVWLQSSARPTTATLQPRLAPQPCGALRPEQKAGPA